MLNLFGLQLPHVSLPSRWFHNWLRFIGCRSSSCSISWSLELRFRCSELKLFPADSWTRFPNRNAKTHQDWQAHYDDNEWSDPLRYLFIQEDLVMSKGRLFLATMAYMQRMIYVKPFVSSHLCQLFVPTICALPDVVATRFYFLLNPDFVALRLC